MFPVALSITSFKTWSAFFVFAAVMFALSVAPVIICFWPERRPMRLGD